MSNDLCQISIAALERLETSERWLGALTTPRPLSEYHEDIGDVLWWKFPIEEAPYVGSPNSLGFTVEAELILRKNYKQNKREVRMRVGGWPGYHTHWTPIPKVNAP